MSDEVAAAVRCRRSQCNNYDTDPPKFQKCGRCRLARYCSRECQLQDWPLHKLMCSADRVLLNEDGTTTPIGAAALAAAGSPVPAPAAAAAAAAAAAPAASTVGADGRDKSVGELLAAAQAKVRDNPYIPHSEMDNKELVSLVVDRLQMQTSPFVVMQLTSGAPPGFLFVQTESPLEDFRWSTGKRADGTKLDRTLNVIYSNLQEFTEEISVGHPNPMLRANKLISTLRSEVNKHSPQEDLVSVAVFGCGFVSCQTSPLAPYKTVLQLVEQDPDMFQGQDAIEICLDRDDA